jgi:hypothetical protein
LLEQVEGHSPPASGIPPDEVGDVHAPGMLGTGLLHASNAWPEQDQSSHVWPGWHSLLLRHSWACASAAEGQAPSTGLWQDTVPFTGLFVAMQQIWPVGQSAASLHVTGVALEESHGMAVL